MILDSHHTTELRRQAFQAEIDARKSPTERNRLGQFATPNALAVEIAQQVGSLIKPDKSIRFADPAIGSGSFFSAALNVFGSSRVKTALGVEIDPEFAEAARQLWSIAGLEVVTADFTRWIGTTVAAPNLMLANPPYVRHHHMERNEKERLQRLTFKMTGVEVNGLAGLYVYFVLLATSWLETGGVAAWLIPSEFMDVNYGAALKKFLTDRVMLSRVHRFQADDVQFGDALVSSVVLVFRKVPPPADHCVEFTLGGTMGEPHVRDMVPIAQLQRSHKWTMYPTHSANDRYLSNGTKGPALGEFFRIQRGIATGCNKFFVLDRADARKRGLPDKYLRPILPSPRYLKTTIIDADDDGYPLIDRQLCVIDCGLPESMLKTEYPELWEYLQTARTLGIMDGYLIGKRSPWYKQEQREPAPFLCTYMGRGSGEKQPFRFIWNRSSAIGNNLYLMLSPRNKLATMLQEHPGRAEMVYALLRQVTGHELRREGRVYGGGLNKIEPNELARISAASFIERWPELSSDIESQGELFK